MISNVAHIKAEASEDLDFIDDFEIRERALEELENRINQAPIDVLDALAGFCPIGDTFQTKVIEDGADTIRVLAPAGSGKTQTIINRALSRIRDGLNANRILLLTFDNSAAYSARSKLEIEAERLSSTKQEIRISTLNAFGYGLLREYFTDEHKSIVIGWKQRKLFETAKKLLTEKSVEIAKSIPGELQTRYFLEFFSLLKNELFDPRSLNGQAFADFLLAAKAAEPLFVDPKNNILVKNVIKGMAWLYGRLEMLYQENNVMDFDDQKLRSYLLLLHNESILNIVQSQYSDITVDEFQDINRLDFEFIKLIASKARLVVVGDDDQAIYGFRGCTPEYIIEFEKHIGRTVSSHELQINYRCPSNIVEHADKLIRHNTWRVKKNPVANSNRKSDIKVVSSLSSSMEAKNIKKFIVRIKQSTANLNWSDFAILYRTNSQSLPLQIELILSDIPYFVRKEDNIVENKSLEKLLGILRLQLAMQSKKRPEWNDCALTVMAYFRFISGTKERELQEYFEQNKRGDFLNLISTHTFHNILPKAEESHLLSGIEDLLQKKDLISTLDVLATKFKGLRGVIGGLEDALDDNLPLGDVYELAAGFRGNTADFVRTLEEAISRAVRMRAGNDEESGLKLLTYFKSKGLQWHTVILTSCNDGLIPHRRAEIEDERRLFYVAMTRASNNLIISYLKELCTGKLAPSRFLGEAGLI